MAAIRRAGPPQRGRTQRIGRARGTVGDALRHDATQLPGPEPEPDRGRAERRQRTAAMKDGGPERGLSDGADEWMP